MNKRIGKYDIIIISIIFAIIMLFNLLFYYFNNKNGNFVVVTVDGNIYGRYSLNTDSTIEIKDSNNEITNIFIIENHSAKMYDASCPDKICMRHKPVSLQNETIVCLPNKIVLTIEADNNSDIDAITN